MKITAKRTLALSALAMGVMFVSCFGGGSIEGKKCAAGSYSTQVKDGKRTNYTCQQTGINPDGSSIYRWVKTP